MMRWVKINAMLLDDGKGCGYRGRPECAGVG